MNIDESVKAEPVKGNMAMAIIAALAGLSSGGADRARSEAKEAARAAASGDFGLTVGEIRKIGERIPPDHSVVIVLFENLWERRFREITKRYGGDVIVQRSFVPEQIARVGKELARDDGKAPETRE